MKYEFAEDIQEIADEISRLLFPHVKLERIKCFRSYGTSSRGTVARCHTIGKLLQKAMNTQAFYALEFLSERFDKMNKEEQVKVIIHELMHIPNSFGGGFRHHDHVCKRSIEKNYRAYKIKQRQKAEPLVTSSKSSQSKETEKEDVFGLIKLKYKNENNFREIEEIKKDAQRDFF